MTLHIATQWCRELGRDLAKLPDTAEDEATLSEVRIEAAGTLLTLARDTRTGRVCVGGNLSACRLAEWLTWNWWRLRWEPAPDPSDPKPKPLGWRQAHELASVGGGWLWPNITIRSDGVQVRLDTVPSQEVNTEPLRYVRTAAKKIPAKAFECGVDDFVQRVLDRLDEWSLTDTDLRTAWNELADERQDPDYVRYRKIEALLGFDVDEGDPQHIEQVIEDGDRLGSEAMSEVVADRPLTAADLEEAARAHGFDASPERDADPPADSCNGFGMETPWRIGTEAARSFRQREELGDGPIADPRLAELYGVKERALSDTSANGQIAFALRNGSAAGDRIVLRSKWRVGRRFELARLLADRVLMVGTDEELRPATRAYTYRQKMQRAFAAEFLCPVEGLRSFLNDGFSDDDATEAAAEKYGVSTRAVTRIIQNNRLPAQSWM